MKWKSKELPLGSFFVMKGFLRLTGPMGRRVLKFDGPLARGLWYRLWTRPNGREGSKGSEGSACLRQAGSKGAGIALRAMSFIIPLRGMENRTTAPTARGNAPLFPCGDFHLKVKRLTTFCASLTLLQNVFAVHPGGGKFALRSALGIISTSMHSTAKSSPFGGKVVPKVPKGVHFQRPQGGLLVFPRPPGRLYGFRCQRQHIYSSPSVDTTTLSGAAAVKPPNPPTEGRSIFRTFRARRALNPVHKAAPLT
jgi:hypothetical protein